MSIFDSTPIQSMLNYPLVSRIRRNHGLEHASLHVLARGFPNKSMAGYSDFSGFWLLGNIPTEAVQSAVAEALQRMKAGEHNLAVHPNCGTNLATAGSLAGLAGLLGMVGVGSRKRDKIERVPMVITLATLALIVAQPLGMYLQRYITTSGMPGALQVVEIIPQKRGRMQAHRVLTQG